VLRSVDVNEDGLAVGVHPLGPFQRTWKATGYALLSSGSQNTEGCAAQFDQKLSDQCLGDIRLGVPWMYSQS
jgi:hypothetical protein